MKDINENLSGVWIQSKGLNNLKANQLQDIQFKDHNGVMR
jgi:hypothetical protein